MTTLFATLEPGLTTMDTIDVLLYVGEPLVRAVLTNAVADARGLRLHSIAESFDELEQAATSVDPDTVVLAWTGGDPARFVARLAASGLGHRQRVLIVAPVATEALVDAVIDAGGAGLLTTDCGTDELLDGVRSVAVGNAPYSPVATRWLVAAARRQLTTTSLTAREQDVLELLADGMLNKQIARGLGISESTVKVHLSRIYQRLGVDNRAAAAMWARMSGYSGRRTGSSERGA